MRLPASALLLGSWMVARASTRSRMAAAGMALTSAASLGYVAVLASRGARAMREARRLAGDGTGLVNGDASGLPTVTLVVPARDEAPVIADIARDLANQRYAVDGRPRFDVVIVDDGSADGTAARARQAVADADGVVQVVRREPGSGPATRGAALNYALLFARGEVLAAIDADARVAPDFVERAMRAWQRDPQAGALQVLKRPINSGSNWLSRAQEEELLLDMCSQCGRAEAGGMAELRGNGMFIRRDVLERLGAWGEEALTEDLDMSTRLAAAGERIALAPEVSVREQAVESLRPLWHQRMRWAEGSVRRMISHGPAVARAPIPLRRKLDVFGFLLTESALPPLLVAALISGFLPSRRGRGRRRWLLPIALFLGYGSGMATLAWGGLAAEGRQGRQLIGGSLRAALFLVHWLAVVPAALLRIALGPAGIRYVKTPRLIRPFDTGADTRAETDTGAVGD